MASSHFCSCSLIVVSLVVLLATPQSSCVVAAGAPKAGDPTEGFTAVSLSNSNFEVQRPYNVPINKRYRFDGTVRQLWVLSNDTAHTPTSKTEPRTEIRIRGYNYSSGVWQFEGYGYVPSGTTGVSIMQVFGSNETATTLMLHVYDGKLWLGHKQQVIEDGIYDRWFKLNVVHDVEASSLTVFVDGVVKCRAAGKGGEWHYFKFGVYKQRDHPSSCMESRWKYVRILKKD